MMFSVTTNIICNDPDVLDALGLVLWSETSREYRYKDRAPWIMKVPKSSDVCTLLNTRRLLKEHVLRVVGSGPVDIITAYDKL